MLQRPKPTQRLVRELCPRIDFLADVHHGLVETPSLKGFYRGLNFLDLLVFAAGSWIERNARSGEFRGLIEAEIDPYTIFNHVYQRHRDLFASLAAARGRITDEKLRELSHKINPFHGRTLRERLHSIPEFEVEELKRELQQEPKHYVTEGEYRAFEQVRADKSGLVILRFMPINPTRERIRQAFAGEISRIIRTCPRKYEPIALATTPSS
ncbi:MAG: hypothetical protein HYS32_00480 [Candidatus Woesearchaeota archaeon]|nr:MAG: hypothetical protein HYS32_00480 [Candidatus Woesearchaeota archaeon]